MKKLMMLVAILALALAAAVPAIAQVSGGGGNSAESEEVGTEFAVSNEGDYASQCVPALQFGNTGNLNNAPNFTQYASESDDFEPGGIGVGLGGSVAADCANTVQQSSAASSQ
jgi:hypothetical protein